MKRRDFIVAMGGAALSWRPPAVHAEQREKMRRIGLLSNFSNAGGGKYLISCFVDGLRDLGWTDGTNVGIDFRWAEGASERFPLLAAELVNSKPDLIVVTSTPGTQAVQKVTRDIPVVFIAVSDPVTSGIVGGLSRPGGNITGTSNFLPAISGKLIELLITVAPNSKRLGVMHNPGNAGKILELNELQEASRSVGVAVVPIDVRSSEEFQAAFSKIMRENCDGLIVLQEGVTLGGRKQIAEFSLSNRLPTIFQVREFVEVGGLMSYGLNYCQHFRLGATYVDKILRGALPADLPVELPTKFELVINAKTAKTLGVEISPALFATADEVIE
jgi:putative tryptophan/tyrosine transport system substrate-binding protein